MTLFSSCNVDITARVVSAQQMRLMATNSRCLRCTYKVPIPSGVFCKRDAEFLSIK